MIYGVHNGKQQKFSIKQKEDIHDTENLWSEHISLLVSVFKLRMAKA